MKHLSFIWNFCLLSFMTGSMALGQEPAETPKADPERWNIHLQSTFVVQGHGSFKAPYTGENSLLPSPEADLSNTETFFLGFRLPYNTEFYVNPEIAGGRGMSGVVGIAGFPNGETTRIISAVPQLYLARFFVRHEWGIGDKSEEVESSANQLRGPQHSSRIALTAGKVAATDFFDDNAYSHDPRTQFLNWSLMYNGAWDYPADTRGYTFGLVGEIYRPRWALRAGTFMVATTANGPIFDKRFPENRGDAVEWEGNSSLWKHPGKLRVLAFMNHANMGSFREALHLKPVNPDLGMTRRPGTLKYGFGLNLEQALTSYLGIFGRFGWNDGKRESWMFTQIDRTASMGLSIHGVWWKRKNDVVGLAAVRNAISGDQRSFLAAGGLGFIIGDGRLNPGSEFIVETYYAWTLHKYFTLTADYQHVNNPAYNKDRGPVSVFAARLHFEF
jgi:high affinity Mn2+ porin